MKRLTANSSGIVARGGASAVGGIGRFRPLSVFLGLAVWAGMCLCGGCGYQGSGTGSGYQWQSLYRQDIQTVAVPIFTSKDFRRGVEFRLTESVIKQLEAHTPYKVVPRDRADTILEGQLNSVRVNVLSRDVNTNLPREQLVTLNVDLVWKNLHTGQIIMERRGFQQSAVYYPPLAEGEFVGSEAALEKLALAIVQEMQAEW